MTSKEKGQGCGHGRRGEWSKEIPRGGYSKWCQVVVVPTQIKLGAKVQLLQLVNDWSSLWFKLKLHILQDTCTTRERCERGELSKKLYTMS